VTGTIEQDRLALTATSPSPQSLPEGKKVVSVPKKRGTTQTPKRRQPRLTNGHGPGFDAGEIGARITEARVACGLSQKELAERIDCSVRALQGYERGVTIPFLYLDAIAYALSRPSEWFLYGEDGPFRDRLARLEAKIEKLARADARRLKALETKIEELQVLTAEGFDLLRELHERERARR
jgi:transcriptional regulator with XRE-family HTH domain